MPLRKSKPLLIRPKGCSDSVDGTNTFPGAMASLANLVPNPSTDLTWVPRPAAVKLTSFAGFNTPGFVSALLVVGNIAYGMIASAKNANKDEPFAYNLTTGAFETITGVLNANTPTSPATTGDWVPPVMAVVGSRIVVTHPGFAGGSPGFFFGWFDISGFSSAAAITGTTHSTKTIDTLSADVLQAGWNVGMIITDASGDIPANTFITSINAAGTSITISNAATGGHSSNALTVVGGTATSPQWGAGNANGFPLLSVPVSVAQMAGRAYYAVGTGVVLSDSGNATQVTNASQALLFDNGVNVTALGPLPLSSPLTGGIVQALIAFQGVTALQVISGDPTTTTNLTVNLAKSGTGTFSPLSIVSYTEGLAFISPEGLRTVDFFARVSNPIGDHGTGISQPFVYAIAPSRTSAASNADTLRMSVQNGFAPSQPNQEWWYDITRKSWGGAHTFPASLIQPWSNTFLMTPVGITASLWQSDPAPSTSSSYTENGNPMGWEYQTITLPDTEDMSMHAIVEATIAANYPPQVQVTIVAMDEMLTVLATVFQAGSGMAGTVWGAFLWGGAPWFGGTGVMKQRLIAWPLPIVFKQGSFQVSGNSLGGLVLGNLYLRYQELGYLLENVL